MAPTINMTITAMRLKDPARTITPTNTAMRWNTRRTASTRKESFGFPPRR